MRQDQSFAVGQHVVLDIELHGGSVLLTAGQSGTVSVAVDGSTPDTLDITQIGDSIAIRATRRSRSARLVVDVPVGTDVSVKGASVDVVARGALGALRVRSASGDVRADDVVRADVTLASGDTRLEVVRDGAEFRATSGDISLGSVGGHLAASLSSGDIQVAELGGDGDVETSSGDVTIRRYSGASVAIRTVSGDVRVGLPSGIRVDPEISTMSGKVSLPDTAAAPTSGERRAVKVRLRTVSGDIRIERASRTPILGASRRRTVERASAASSSDKEQPRLTPCRLRCRRPPRRTRRGGGHPCLAVDREARRGQWLRPRLDEITGAGSEHTRHRQQTGQLIDSYTEPRCP